MAYPLKDIPGFSGRYAASTDGRIWSYSKWRQKTGRWLKPGSTRDGYLYVNLYSHGRYRSFRVSRLVLETFVGPAPTPCADADHRDFDRSNNQLSNLRWLTHQENVERTKYSGRVASQVGINNPSNFLTETEVSAIRARRSKGSTYRSIANEFGIRKGHVADICTRRIWKHI